MQILVVLILAAVEGRCAERPKISLSVNFRAFVENRMPSIRRGCFASGAAKIFLGEINKHEAQIRRQDRWRKGPQCRHSQDC